MKDIEVSFKSKAVGDELAVFIE